MLKRAPVAMGFGLDAVCIGHSHSAAIAEASAETGAGLEVLNFWHLPGAIVRDDGPVHFAPHVRARLTARGAAPVFSLVGGAVHYDVGLLLHPTPFDFIDPALPGEPLVPGAALIPYGAMRAGMEVRTRPYLDIMDMVRQAVDGPVFHMQSPPVYQDERVHESDPGWVAFHGTGRVIAPPAFRRKLWRLHSAIVADHCAATGIAFVPCPKAALDSAGYLKVGLNGRPAHANAAYGALVIEQIRGLMGEATGGRRAVACVCGHVSARRPAPLRPRAPPARVERLDLFHRPIRP